MNKNALLVIDVQNRLFQLKKPIHEPEQLILKINNLIDKARSGNTIVIFIQHENSTTLKFQSKDWFLHPKVHTNEHDFFIRKTEKDSFFETSLGDLLQQNKTEKLVICGLLSNLCVKHTCIGAIKHQFNTTLASDAHSNNSSKPEQVKASVNNEVNKLGVKLENADDVNFN
jgi:nicotinamidase-related amidase